MPSNYKVFSNRRTPTTISQVSRLFTAVVVDCDVALSATGLARLQLESLELRRLRFDLLFTVMWCLEAQFSLPRPRSQSRPSCLGLGLSLDPPASVSVSTLLPQSWPRSRLSCLGLATASRHQSQRSQFFSHNVLRN